MSDQRIYLRLGDRVLHRSHEEWGEGVVVEEMTSSVPGGTCLVRIQFEDGRQRTFNNDMENDLCCYFFGVRKIWQLEVEPLRASPRASRRRIQTR